MVIPGLLDRRYWFAIRIPRHTEPHPEPRRGSFLQRWLPILIWSIEANHAIWIELNRRSAAKRLNTSSNEVTRLFTTGELWRLAGLIAACDGALTEVRKIDIFVRQTVFDPPILLSKNQEPHLMYNIDVFQQDGHTYVVLRMSDEAGRGVFKTAQPAVLLEWHEETKMHQWEGWQMRLSGPLNGDPQVVSGPREDEFLRLFLGCEGIIQIRASYMGHSRKTGRLKLIFLLPPYRMTLHDLLSHPNASQIGQSERHRIAKTLLTGLAIIHEKGVLHGDLKCSNILVNFQEGLDQAPTRCEAAISDFGHARFTNASGADIDAMGAVLERLFPRDHRPQFVDLIINQMRAKDPPRRPSAQELLLMWNTST